MEYGMVREAVFCRRLNRFLAEVQLDGCVTQVHVKNTGRLGELLLPGARVWLEPADNPARKTAFSLISVEKDGRVVNIDSQIPNRIVFDALREGRIFPGMAALRREYTYGNSRFDIYGERDGKPWLMEVKGVTLNVDGEARFPDAPTERGLKHVHELTEALEQGYGAGIIFAIQMKGVHLFRPNDRTMPGFGLALAKASAAGVWVKAYDCLVTPGSLVIDREVPVVLPELN